MRTMKKSSPRLGFFIVALCTVLAVIACAAEDSASQPNVSVVTVENEFARMQVLADENKWQAIVDQFEETDFSSWPDAGEAFNLRGTAYFQVRQGAKAVLNLQAAVERVPDNGYIWHNLGDAYRQLRKDDARALDAYKKTIALEDKSAYVVPAATYKAADILLHQVKTDAAMEMLHHYSDDEMKKLHPYWQVQILRVYGEAYALQGRDAEAWAKFKEALVVERGQ